jgi:very-short-patch-repair endonuclease
LGLKFRRQQVIGAFFADLYCAELHVALEIDGGIHDAPDVASYDEVRELELLTHGVAVLRVRSEDVTAEHLRDVLAARLATQYDEQGRPLSRGPLPNLASATTSPAVGARGRGGHDVPRRPRGG